MFDSLARKYDEKVLIRAVDKDSVVEFSWHEVFDFAMNTAIALRKAGVGVGDKVAMISANRPHWIFADLGIMMSGAVSVPIFPSLSTDIITHILKETGVKVLFVDTETTAMRVMARLDFLETLKKIVLFDSPDSPRQPMVSFDDFLRSDATPREKQELRHEYMDLGPDDIHTIIYTPGVSGRPKGVMLTSGNILSNCSDNAVALPLLDTDEFMSYLDLSHAFERTAGYYTAMYVGAAINFPQSPGTILQDMRRLQPSVMCTVPYFFNLVRPKVETQVLNKLGAIGRIALKISGQSTDDKNVAGASSFLAGIMGGAADKLVFRKIRDFFGGRIRFFVSGSAPLPPETAKFFHRFGILILEGYGLTEAGPVVSVNRVDNFRFGSVGLPLRNAKIKFARDGEILVKGPSVMRGYFNQPEETARAFDQEGWLKTGDIGELDPDGFLHITDRKKDLIKTSTGKLIAPQEIETRLLEIPYVERAVVIGEGQPHLVAVIFPAFPQLRAWARQRSLNFDDNEHLVRIPEVIELFRKSVHDMNTLLAPFERIHGLLLIGESHHELRGIISPSLRVNRKMVAERFAEQLKGALISVNKD